MTNKFLIVGLGNPGIIYQKNRHNIGAYFLCWLRKRWLFPEFRKNKKLLAEFSSVKNKQKQIILTVPLLFMNESGKSISISKRIHQIPLKNIFVVHDDSDIAGGEFKLSFDRGSAGHKGIDSIIRSFGSQKFHRLRIGVRQDAGKRKKADEIVLKNFQPEEVKKIEEKFEMMGKELEKRIEKIIAENR